MYYEIEYDSSPIPGVGKFVLKSEKVDVPERDVIRDTFDKMRDIARGSRVSYYGNPSFYDRQMQYENAKVFYEQGIFMKDFEDDYEEVAEYDSYYPSYQMMGYKQLRTYFTWRTKVRKGIMERTCSSYAFLYMYELVNNIGVRDAQDGFNKLLFFWNDYREYDENIDRYVIKWLKDYYIYYDLPGSFREFVSANNLDEYYPELPEAEEEFELYLAISKYNITRSVFYTEDRENLIKDCFKFVVERLKDVFKEHHADFDKAVFWPVRNMPSWMPFSGAVFYPHIEQRDRQVVISGREAYICKRDVWAHNTALATEGGKQFVGYIMKQMEATLRECVKFKYKITASIHTVNSQIVTGLIYAGVDFDEVIEVAVKEFYREATKTVVKVDLGSLNRIREEAFATQEKLIVPEEESVTVPIFNVTRVSEKDILSGQSTMSEEWKQEAVEAITAATVSVDNVSAATDTPWSTLWSTFNDTEKEAVRLSLNGAFDMRGFADAHGIMLEVLLDGINEKAMDVIGDSIMDDEFMIYADYTDDIRKVVD